MKTNLMILLFSLMLGGCATEHFNLEMTPGEILERQERDREDKAELDNASLLINRATLLHEGMTLAQVEALLHMPLARIAAFDHGIEYFRTNTPQGFSNVFIWFQGDAVTHWMIE